MTTPYTPLASHPAPAGFRFHSYHKTFRCKFPLAVVWAYFNRTKTFTQGQPPFFFVEFVSPEAGKPANFRPGVMNTHHGFFLHLPAVITLVEAKKRRHMAYLYGAWVLNFRLLRPTALNFEFQQTREGETLVHLELNSWVRPWFSGIWNLGLRAFWGMFGLGLNREIHRYLRAKKTATR